MSKEPLDRQQIESCLGGVCLGRQVLVLDVVTSTNDLVRLEAERGASEGIVVVAEEQTLGRGRGQRRWVSGYGESLLLSVLLRPRLPASSAFLLTALATVAAADAIEEVCSLRCELKWPNDLIRRDRKVAGFLTETSVVANRIEWAVVGAGINVSTSFPGDPELAARATSLEAEAGHPISRNDLAVRLLRQMSERYRVLTERGPDDLFHEWRQRLGTLGRKVIVGYQHEGQLAEPLEGLAEDVDPDGALRLRLSDGSSRRILSGDISLR